MNTFLQDSAARKSPAPTTGHKMQHLRIPGRYLAGCALALGLLCSFPFAQAAEFDVLWSFKGPAQGDGAFPSAGLLRDSAGNLLGTTGGGGTASRGTVFKLAPDGTETVLYSFKGGNGDGAGPGSQLVADAAGNLYGTTVGGGPGNGGSGFGTVFRLAPDGTETVLHFFSDQMKDGFYPMAGLVMDPAGNLYGTTQTGGTPCDNDKNGCGTVFEIMSGGEEKILHRFKGGDGSLPYYGSLVLDTAGNLYGTTAGVFTFGNIFKISPDGKETVLHTCRGSDENDCQFPYGGLSIDQDGNLYGTSAEGGYRFGDVFKVAPDGTFTELYAFTGGKDSMYPDNGVMLDKSGNLYGTTQGTAGYACQGCATVFRVTPDGKKSVLHRFERKDGGLGPWTELISDGNGYLYGTTNEGGTGGSGRRCGQYVKSHGCGTVFRLKE
ncbi:MAG TPA: choice-of-anchor tandem repeat GloVer-containing protein [Rhizomicrobium sp.]|jgi:uncharacterized repeat protein (TIGR03803 family)